MELLLAEAEPDTAARREELRLVELGEPEQAAVEGTRLVLAPFGGSDLDVVERDDHRDREVLDAPRGPGLST